MSTPPTRAPMTHEQQRILAVVLVPVFMSLLAVSSVNVVLPAMQSAIHASDTGIQWVISGYTLVFGVVLVAAGRAGDVYGRGWLFAVGLTLFGLGSLLSGLAIDATMLSIVRLVMGAGAGLLTPQTIGFIQQYFTGHARARAFASFGAVVGVSVAVGPLLSGTFVALFGEDWGWRLTFLVNVPIAFPAIVVAWRWFPRSAFTRTKRKEGVDLDPVGMLLFGIAVLFIMVPFLERDAGPVVFALTPVGLGLLGLWLSWERRHARRGGSPMVDLELFGTPSYANGVLLIGLHFTGVTSVWVILAMYLQNGHGATALQAALVGLPAAVTTGLASTYAGRLVLTVGRRLVAIGISIVLASMLLTIGVLAAHAFWGLSPWWLALTLAFLGAGQGLVVSPNQTLSLLDVPHEYSGSAGGVMQTGQRVGTAVGTALITAVFFVLKPDYGWDWAGIASFCLITMLSGLALGVALLDIRMTRPATS